MSMDLSRIRGLRDVHLAAQRLRRRVTDSSTCLMLTYHRVADLSSDPQRLAVSTSHFREQLKALRGLAHPLGLQDLVGVLRSRREVPRRGVVITFDDGYADNLHNAKPILENHEMPATVFPTWANLDKGTPFWWDELERILLLPGRLPAVLELDINAKTCRWDLGDGIEYGTSDHRRNLSWNVGCRPSGPRQEIYLSLCRLLHPMPPQVREAAMEDIVSWAFGNGSGDRDLGFSSSHRPLSKGEVVKLARGGLIEIGAHTVKHPILSRLAPEEQEREIRESKGRLEELLGMPVTAFAYPYGSWSDYGPATASIVKRSGFSCGCANFPGPVWQDTDVYQLPRVVVRDWDREEFQGRLEAWFHS